PGMHPLIVVFHGFLVARDASLESVVVYSKPHMIDPDALLERVYMGDELIEGGPARRRNETWVANRTDHASGFGNGIEQFIRSIARAVVHRLGIRMRQNDGCAGALDGIHRSAEPRMAAIDDDPRLVQALDQLDAKTAQARVGSLFTTVPD